MENKMIQVQIESNYYQPNLELEYQHGIDLQNQMNISNEVQYSNFIPNQSNLLNLQDFLQQLNSLNEKQKKVLTQSFNFKMKAVQIKCTCSICHKIIRKRTKTPQLKCMHYFHLNCLKTWLKQKNQCPVCRNNLNDK